MADAADLQGTGRDFGLSGKNAKPCCGAISRPGFDGPELPRYMIVCMTLTRPTFPAPDHDHGRCTADAIAHAERVCQSRAQKFTPIRRQVLQALLSSHRPLGAYEVIDDLAKSMPRPAPITVYRALDFLMENGLVHRIESRNAYLACAHDHDAAAMVAFLICEACGSVGEIPAAPVAQSLNAAARASGFAPKLSVVEITGTCAHCQKT
jgi:Fur family zinc uptake transcriptional regulator